MNTSKMNKILDVVVILCFVIGLILLWTPTAQMALLFWSVPAGYGAGSAFGNAIFLEIA